MERYEFAVLRWHSGRGEDGRGECSFSHRSAWVDLGGSLCEVLRRLGEDGFALVGSIPQAESVFYFQRPLD